jgi:hypothetical protein
MSVCKLYTCVLYTNRHVFLPRGREKMLHRSQTCFVLNVCCQSWRLSSLPTQILVLLLTKDKELETNPAHFIYIVQEKSGRDVTNGLLIYGKIFAHFLTY